jgi:type I restriction enzyme M protein
MNSPFEEKMKHLVKELNGQFAESAKLEQAIKANLKGLGYSLGEKHDKY